MSYYSKIIPLHDSQIIKTQLFISLFKTKFVNNDNIIPINNTNINIGASGSVEL
ncbi:hypothetical protein Harman_38450 [Haloarcula mannanilytica]|uniref:Uncharacterized protein n=1 Tax=Haloarcula mannanilytica TaxID=2509225 RepID=A0A4C2ER07_9EURY|nr:hypothetical protein Harman_38450 [Haloarcula mannanilytica]